VTVAQTFHIRIEGFEPFVQDPADGICKAFGVDRGRAQKILARVPAIVKKDASREQAASYLRALAKIGAQVVAIDASTGEVAADLEPPSRAPQPLGQPSTVGRADGASGTVFGLPGRDTEDSDEEEATAAPSKDEPLSSGLRDPFRVLREPDLLQLERLMAGVEDGRFSSDPAASDPFGKLASESLRALPDDSGLGRRDTGRVARGGGATTSSGPRTGNPRPARPEASRPTFEADPFDIAVLPNSGSVKLPPAAPAAKADNIASLIDDLYGDTERRRTRQPVPREPQAPSRPSQQGLRSVPSADWAEDPVAAAPREQLRWAPSGEWPGAGVAPAPVERRTPPPRKAMVPPTQYDAGPPTPQQAVLRAQQREREHVRAMASCAYAIAAPASRTFDPEPRPPAGPVALRDVDPFEPAGWQPLMRPNGDPTGSVPAVNGPALSSTAAPVSPALAAMAGRANRRPSDHGSSAPPSAADQAGPAQAQAQGQTAAPTQAPPTGARTYAEAAAPATLAAAAEARRTRETRSIVIVAVAVVLCLIGIVVAVTLVGGGKPNDAESLLLSNHGQQYLPGFEPRDEWAGSLAAGARTTLRARVPVGTCQGWVAASEEGAACDLDLLLVEGDRVLASDVARDGAPVVFACADTAVDATLEVRNASAQRCSYALGAFGRPLGGSQALDPYPALYARLAEAPWSSGVTETLVILGDVQRASLTPGAVDSRNVTIPAGACRTVIGVAAAGTNLDATIRAGSEVISSDVAPDEHPMVSACASGQSWTVAVEFSAAEGGDFVWQVFDGRIGAR
jgi:hypothetical protein